MAVNTLSRFHTGMWTEAHLGLSGPQDGEESELLTRSGSSITVACLGHSQI